MSMKKIYRTPETEIIELTVEDMIAASPVSSDFGIGYGGVDNTEEGLDPQ